jgi:flagellar hook-associated protein 3 FlgL
MRIASETLFRLSTGAMQTQTAQLAQVQTQIASGRQFQHAHEAPAAAARVVEWEAAQTRLQGQGDAADRVQHRLGLSENALGDARNILDRVNELMISAGNAALNADDRATLAGEVGVLAEEWERLANARDGVGQPLFAGTSLDDAFVAGVYQGTPDNRQVEVADGQRIRDGVTGERVFGDATGQSSFQWLADAQAAMLEPDAALRTAALDTARGGLTAVGLNVESARTEVGVLGNALDRAATWRDAAEAELINGLSRLRDTDFVDAATRLTQASTQLSAAQSAYLKTSSLSLFDRLR